MPINFKQDPTLPPGFSITFGQRFWKKVKITDSCYLWIGSIKWNGYGEIQPGRRGMPKIMAHQASWLLHYGFVPEGQNVLHDCPGGDNRACVRPEHLWLGSQSENLRDAMIKRSENGQGHWCAKLTPENVIEIRRLRQEGMLQSEIAIRFGVLPNMISRIVNHRRWRLPIISSPSQ